MKLGTEIRPNISRLCQRRQTPGHTHDARPGMEILGQGDRHVVVECGSGVQGQACRGAGKGRHLCNGLRIEWELLSKVWNGLDKGLFGVGKRDVLRGVRFSTTANLHQWK